MRTRTSLAVVLATVVAAALMMVGAGAAHANYPYPPADPRGVTPMAVDVAPPTCVTAAPAGNRGVGRQRQRPVQQGGCGGVEHRGGRCHQIRLLQTGHPYSQDPTQRATTMFDCSSFVGRAQRRRCQDPQGQRNLRLRLPLLRLDWRPSLATV